jgi:2'-5' RNA ligase
MKKSLFILLFLSISAFAAEPARELSLSKEILSNGTLPFVSHHGRGRFDNTLALNVVYAPIQALRRPIEEGVGRRLKFLTSWKSDGEAHVTVITPPEFSEVLSPYLTMEEIEKIAQKDRIQESELIVLGLGSGKAILDGEEEETYFVIVDSENLRKIRHDVYRAFLEKGGSPNAWDPTWWFPHITIGFTRRDLHEADGVIKNIRQSWDSRFHLMVH